MLTAIQWGCKFTLSDSIQQRIFETFIKADSKLPFDTVQFVKVTASLGDGLTYRWSIPTKELSNDDKFMLAAYKNCKEDEWKRNVFCIWLHSKTEEWEQYKVCVPYIYTSGSTLEIVVYY